MIKKIQLFMLMALMGTMAIRSLYSMGIIDPKILERFQSAAKFDSLSPDERIAEVKRLWPRS